MSLLIFAYEYGHFICRVKSGGGPNLAIIKKPDACAPHERRLGVLSCPRGRGIILKCLLCNYLSHCRVKKGNYLRMTHPEGAFIGADFIIANFGPPASIILASSDKSGVKKKRKKRSV